MANSVFFLFSLSSDDILEKVEQLALRIVLEDFGLTLSAFCCFLVKNSRVCGCVVGSGTEIFCSLACCLVNQPELANFSLLLKLWASGDETLGFEEDLLSGLEGVVVKSFEEVSFENLSYLNCRKWMQKCRLAGLSQRIFCLNCFEEKEEKECLEC